MKDGKYPNFNSQIVNIIVYNDQSSSSAIMHDNIQSYNFNYIKFDIV